MKRGDIVPWPNDVVYDPAAVKAAMGMRGTARIAKRKGDGAASRVARAHLAVAAERDARDADPFEQAKRFLQQRGVVVFSTAVLERNFDVDVIGPKKIRAMLDTYPWVVGDREVATRDEVIGEARRRGWVG